MHKTFITFSKIIVTSLVASTLTFLPASPVNTVLAEEASTEATTPKETIVYTDDLGREVEIPANIERILGTGSTSQIVLYSVAPERMVGWSNQPDTADLAYMPEAAAEIPEVGGLFNGPDELNLEAIIDLAPDVIIDVGEQKEGIQEELDQLSELTGVPIIFFNGNLDDMPALYTNLGEVLGVDTAEQVAYIETTLKRAAEHQATIQADGQTYYLANGDNGFKTAPADSFHTEVFDRVGLTNVLSAEEAEGFGWQDVSGEQVLAWQPDSVTFLYPETYAERDQEFWDSLETDAIYLVPDAPYNWLTGPKSVNAILGINWAGQMYYPDVYQLNLVEEAQSFYQLFYHYELSTEEAEALLTGPTSAEV